MSTRPISLVLVLLLILLLFTSHSAAQMTLGSRVSLPLPHSDEMLPAAATTAAKSKGPNNLQLLGIRQVSAGTNHTCAITELGSVICWGRNAFGQLGDGTTVDRLTPVLVKGLTSNIVAVSAGANHTCALTAEGAVKCWGRNKLGQLGDHTTTDRLEPVDVVGLQTGVKAIAAAQDWSSEYDGTWTCALTTTGGVKCWGYNASGQLGNGTTTSSSVPTNVMNLSSGVTSIAAGYLESCAVTTAGRILCWGYGYRGNNSWGPRTYPREMVELTSPAVQTAVGDVFTFALTSQGAVRYWTYRGGTGSFVLMDPYDLTGDAVSIATNGRRTCCVLTRSGGVRCDNQPISTLTDGVTGITASAEGHTCVLLQTGAVRCWGRNGYGQLGDGTTVDRSTPIDVSPILIDDAELALQPQYPTVAPGAPVNFWINVRNTGTTTWRASDGYSWRGDDQWLGDSGPVTGETPSGGIWRFERTFNAPTTPGEYVYGFMMRHGTQEFGPYFFLRVTVMPPKWTLMYYLAGDNDLSTQTSEVNDLLLATQVKSTGLANVVVALDGLSQGDSGYYAYTSIQTRQIPKGEVNMGDPQALSNFVTWAKTTYPADHYALVVFDHGNGVGGVASDRASSLPWVWEERLTPQDLAGALPSKVDVVVMRACLMGMIEIAYELQGKADYYVASETVQYGTDSHGPGDIAAVLPMITESTTPRQLAQYFFDRYKQGALHQRAGDIAILSMAEIPNLISRVKVLAQSLLDHMGTETAVLSAVSQSVQRVNMTNGDLTLDSADEYVDLRHFAQLIELQTTQPDVRSAAGAVKYAVDQSVKDHYQHGGKEGLEIAEGTWIFSTLYYTNTSGISISFPSQPRSFFTGNWSSWAAGVTSWTPQPHTVVAPGSQTAEPINPWMQLLIDYTWTTNPVDNPNPPELLPVFPANRPRLYLPLIRR